jgi:hypothetical protein
MAKALPAGRPVRSRPVFGLFDPEGWGWATTKAVFWLLVIIMTLGYIPDRAYYFVVSRTIELGILGWSPINLCPPENGTNMPCPVPAGAVVPWQSSPAAAALPAARANGAAAQLGKNLLYIGGTDGSAPTATTYVAQVENGNFAGWTEGPALTEARSDPGIAVLSGTAYLVGGEGPSAKATDTVWSIGLDPDTSALGTWAVAQDKDKADVKLPEPRSGASVVAVTDGIVVAGGRDAAGTPSNKVWKATVDATSGKLGQFAEQPNMAVAVADSVIALEGTYLWVYGGSDANGPTNVVQRATYGVAPAAVASGAAGSAAGASPAASAAPEGVVQWATLDAANLPAARDGAVGFAANGALYLVGGRDSVGVKRELYWATPDSTGNLPGGWFHLDQTDLPAGLVDGAPVVSGVNAFILGGTSDGGASTGAYRASLAPQAPFFQLGIAGVVVPGLQIGGEIGQQLGYLAAAGVGTGNFVLLVIVGWIFNNREKIGAWWRQRRADREARAPKAA